jgi:Protein of unknown function (DUF3168)
MIDPSLALQQYLVAQLKDCNTIEPVMPKVFVADTGGRPEIFPYMIVGEAHTVFPNYSDSFHIQTFADVHIWTLGADLAATKRIAGNARAALFKGPWNVEGFFCRNLHVESTRFMRDPDGLHGHGVISISAILQESVQL